MNIVFESIMSLVVGISLYLIFIKKHIYREGAMKGIELEVIQISIYFVSLVISVKIFLNFTSPLPILLQTLFMIILVYQTILKLINIYLEVTKLLIKGR